MSNGDQQLAKSTLSQMKVYLGNDEVKQRFSDMLGKRSSSFTNSLINVVRNSKQLQNCTPDSIMSAAIIPATLNLSIEPALGQGYIIGYGSTATFQIGYKGIIQLCIRSGQYAMIHCSEIYADELKGNNPITGQVTFKDPSTFKMRSEGSDKNVIGHYAYFKLISGFEKAEYMTVAEVMAHAKKFSQAYQYDLRSGKKASPWSTYPIAMGNKTALKKLLSKFGLMSVEMQKAIVHDEEAFDEQAEATRRHIEAEQGSEPIEANFETPAQEQGELTPQQKAAQTRKNNKEAKAKAKAEAAKKQEAPAVPPVTNQTWVCNDPNCKVEEFTNPKQSGTQGHEVLLCPTCFSANISVKGEAKDFMQDE